MRTLNRKSEKNIQTPLDPLITGGRFNDLKNKLESLKKNSRPAAAEEVSRLAEMGDFSENFGYQAAKGRLRGINNLILKIETQLNQAVIISPPKKSNTVQIGSRVIVETNGKQKTYQILGSAETDPKSGIISYTSPIGAGLLERQVGEVFSISIAGRLVEFKILGIE